MSCRRRVLILPLAAVCALVATAAPYADANLDRVLGFITKEDVVELTRTMVRIRSDYSEGSIANHNEIANFLAGELKKLDMTVTMLEPMPKYPIVVGRMKGSTSTPVLGAMGHYNTVPVGDRTRWTVDPFEALVRDGKIWGLGANDQKSGIAALLVATRAIVRANINLRGDLVHLYIPGEGAQDHVLPLVADTRPELIKTDWYLDTDGGPDIIQVAAGHLWLKVTVKGKAAHPGGDKPWVNAGYKLAKVLVAMEDLDSWMTYEKHPLFTSLGGKPRVQVGMIRAGEAVNQIPDVAEARFDIRLNPRQTPDGVLKELDGLLAKLKASDSELNIAVERLPGTQNVPFRYWASITPDEPFIKVLREVAKARLGREPGFIGSRAGGRPDLWRIGSKWISWSANEGGNSHSPDEWVSIDGIYRSAQVYAEIFLRMLE